MSPLRGAVEGAKWVLAFYGLVLIAVGMKTHYRTALWLIVFVLIAACIGARYG